MRDVGENARDDPPVLMERRDGFAYNYRMRCECGGVSTLSAQDYVAEANRARMDCEHCGRSIHFGPIVAAIRDEHDPALRDELVTTFAWYHTSTQPDWPSPNYAARFENNLTWDSRAFLPSRADWVAEQTSKALHVGTYEAAIENMLRRMDDQGDAESQFYLYRIALEMAPGRVNPRYRNENTAAAADIGVNELDKVGLDVVRYLNVNEAMGTLSLAVRPGVIAAVQRLAVPVPDLAVKADCAAISVARDALVEAARALRLAEASTSIDHRERRLMEFGMRPDPEGIAKRIGAMERHYYDCRDALEQALAACALPHTSPVIQREFNDAVADRRIVRGDPDIAAFIARYQRLAALLERPSDVIARVSREEWRTTRGQSRS